MIFLSKILIKIVKSLSYKMLQYIDRNFNPVGGAQERHQTTDNNHRSQTTDRLTAHTIRRT